MVWRGEEKSQKKKKKRKEGGTRGPKNEVIAFERLNNKAEEFLCNGLWVLSITVGISDLVLKYMEGNGDTGAVQ